METTIRIQELKKSMIKELTDVFDNVNHEEVYSLVDEILHADRIFIYGLGRERLMLQAFCMRLMHLGLSVHMIGDVTTPNIRSGDLFITSSGTGYLSTVEALLNIVKKEKSRIAFFTAHPEEELPMRADVRIKIPSQTMRVGIEQRTSLQPMGSLFEQTQLLVFELVILLLKERMGQTDEDMEKRHTNLE